MNRAALTIIAVALLGFGCVRQELVVPSGSIPVAVEENTWAQQTNANDQVDISDIEENITTESQTHIVQSQPTIVKRIAFPIKEYLPYAKNGNATVQGRVYLIDLYDQAVVGSNTRLYLNPVTSYSTQWYQESYLGGKKMEKADQRLFNYLRFTTSDAEGNFAFYGVPAGKYFLVATVPCSDPCGFESEKRVRIATIVEVPSHNAVVKKDLVKKVELD